MKTVVIILFGFITGVQAVFGQNQDVITLGEQIVITSHILNEERTCLISFPDTYTNTSKEFPIIILLDGYAHFKITSGIVHFMGSQRSRNNFMPESIVVAIENIDRERDFTVTKINTKRPNTMGGGKNFLKFIENELVPYIDNHYRTTPTRTLIGHSLGGLLTLNSYLDENSLFDAYISIDPSVWWDKEMMKERVDTITPSSSNKKLYIATANHGETGNIKNKQRHDLLYELLSKQTEEAQNVNHEYFESEDHHSVLLLALYNGLKYINQPR
ncbi:hypothetical protein BXY82_1060 [Gelidibacter sediminis]|uniref:Alpha/beta superfamily hydrolase n=1 Tax=Gelidibacter sediminis TaxID=1608710 RepID=A0A4R7Q7X2_9FLAO|nr:alpha/beta hydrolase-fold protein [Gelidibacter sediminis]TDU43644.1 hypothetical protein BXY82_1060 [Gelidibacter sediminis]